MAREAGDDPRGVDLEYNPAIDDEENEIDSGMHDYAVKSEKLMHPSFPPPRDSKGGSVNHHDPHVYR